MQMCEDLAADNVMYAEIRTTPKNRPECNIVKRSYVEAVLAGISQFEASTCAALPSAQLCVTKFLIRHVYKVFRCVTAGAMVSVCVGGHGVHTCQLCHSQLSA